MREQDIGFLPVAENERRIGLATDQSTARMGIHSEYLRILAETGVIGFAAALLAGFVLLRFSIRALRTASTPLRRALTPRLYGPS